MTGRSDTPLYPLPDRMRAMRWIKEMSPELLPLVIAIAVPLAGVVLALQIWVTGDRRRSLRVIAAAVLGTCAWTIALTA
jgi:hypothetical protein